MSERGSIIWSWSFDPSVGRILFKPRENDRDYSIKNKKDGSISRKIDTRVEMWEDFWKRILDRIGIVEESMVFILPEWKKDQRHKWEIFSMVDGFVLREIRWPLRPRRDPRNGGNPVELLGEDVLFVIFSRLSIRDLYNLAPVSKSWNSTIANNPEFWKYYCIKHIPDARTKSNARSVKRFVKRSVKRSVKRWKGLAIYHISDLPSTDPPMDLTFGSNLFLEYVDRMDDRTKTTEMIQWPLWGLSVINFDPIPLASSAMMRRWHIHTFDFENLERENTGT